MKKNILASCNLYKASIIPETKPLARMYARMYNARQDHLVEFETLFPDHTEFFILKKRSCHANQNSKIHQI